MKVSELIRKLEKLPGDAVVVVGQSDDGRVYALESVSVARVNFDDYEICQPVSGELLDAGYDVDSVSAAELEELPGNSCIMLI